MRQRKRKGDSGQVEFSEQERENELFNGETSADY